jgi:predicted metal-dependent hydrolase
VLDDVHARVQYYSCKSTFDTLSLIALWYLSRRGDERLAWIVCVQIAAATERVLVLSSHLKTSLTSHQCVWRSGAPSARTVQVVVPPNDFLTGWLVDCDESVRVLRWWA